MSDDIQLFILGAGCSAGYGYPAAASMLSSLDQFAEQLGEKATCTRALVKRTTDLMRQLRVQTIDELAHRVYQGHGNDPHASLVEQTRTRFRRIAEAKAAVSALFYKLEAGAAATGLRSYHGFLHRIFPNHSGANYMEALARSTSRIFSFNYDRLFEIAFLQHFNVDRSYAFYYKYGLNSGIDPIHPSRIEIFSDRFSFLKLHGSIGMRAEDDHGDVCHGYSIPSVDGSFELSDASFFKLGSDGRLSEELLSSTIFFPHEKEYLLSGRDTAFPYRIYAKKVWREAEAMAAHANEICLIGYSVCETDFIYIENLLRAATNCTRIIVQNPDARNICERLRIRLPGLGVEFVPHELSF